MGNQPPTPTEDDLPPPPPANDTLDAFQIMLLRRSCRAFMPRRLTQEHREALLSFTKTKLQDDNRLSTQPIRVEYAESVPRTSFLIGPSEYLIGIVSPQYDSPAILDLSRALQHVILKATEMGIGTCWMGAFDQSSAERVLQAAAAANPADGDDDDGTNITGFDPERDHVAYLVAIGYPAVKTPFIKRVMSWYCNSRVGYSSLFFDGDFGTPMSVSEGPDGNVVIEGCKYGRVMEGARRAPSANNLQTSKVVRRRLQEKEQKKEESEAEESEKSELFAFSFYASSISRWYKRVNLGIWMANWEYGCAELGIKGHFELPEGGDPEMSGRGGLSSPAPVCYAVWVEEGEEEEGEEGEEDRGEDGVVVVEEEEGEGEEEEGEEEEEEEEGVIEEGEEETG